MIAHSGNSRNTPLMKDANKGEKLPLVSAHPSFHKKTSLHNLFPLAALGPTTEDWATSREGAMPCFFTPLYSQALFVPCTVLAALCQMAAFFIDVRFRFYLGYLLL